MKRFITLLFFSSIKAESIMAYALQEQSVYTKLFNDIAPVVTEGIARAKYFESIGLDTVNHSIISNNHPYLFKAKIAYNSNKQCYFFIIQFHGVPLLSPNSVPNINGQDHAILGNIAKSLQGKYIVFALNAQGLEVLTNQQENFSRSDGFDNLSDIQSINGNKIVPLFTVTNADIPEFFKSALYVKMTGSEATAENAAYITA